MNKFSPRHLLIAAALFGIAAETAWSEEATSSEPAAQAEQKSPSATGDVQEYAPTSYRNEYEQYWQPPPWPEPPPPPPPPRFYGHPHPYYPPHQQYRSAPAAPAENPLNAELTQTQDQLAAKTAELDATSEQLTNLRAEQQAAGEAMQQAQEQLATKDTELNAASEKLATLQAEQEAAREALQKTQSETALASEQLSVVMEQMDILNNVLIELKARIDEQNTSLLSALQADAEESDKVDGGAASEAEQVQSPAKTPVQPEKAGGAESEAGDKEPAKPEGVHEI